MRARTAIAAGAGGICHRLTITAVTAASSSAPKIR
jgi:hypothetical protein